MLFSVLFKTEPEGSSRFEFSYYDVTLKKIDVQSVGNQIEIPETPKVLGSCRENNRKILRVKKIIFFSILDSHYKRHNNLQNRRPVIRRPFDSSLHKVRILIPQSVACCLIRALFLSNADLDAYTSVSTRFVTSSRIASKRLLEVFDLSSTPPPIATSATPPTTDPNKWSKFTLGKNPTVSSTPLNRNPKAHGPMR
ncbi:Protein CBG00729 [Caenorhabditis briggsae]|uniref:Protein CBG00729 n=1 Tax=Caenorhabditis briggsae TaxID=6238 RepID=A8WN73_CAEBR|nr:Protein CBG00729 [Caenorhabditis briggsae]CAP21928.2 Protein CBG00729 [Caenorhabditis briggsae]